MIMGWTPRDVRACSLPDFAVAVDAFNAQHAPPGPDTGPEALARLDELMDRYPDG